MVARSHVTHENIEAMSRDEIAEQLQEIMGRAKDRMKDVTPLPELIENDADSITCDSGEASEWGLRMERSGLRRTSERRRASLVA